MKVGVAVGIGCMGKEERLHARQHSTFNPFFRLRPKEFTGKVDLGDRNLSLASVQSKPA